MPNRDRLETTLSIWLSLGLFTLLTGFFWLTDRSLYSKSFYALFAVPALLGLIVTRTEMLKAIKQPAVLLFLVLAAWVLISLGWAEGDKVSSSLVKRPLYIFLALAGMLYLGAARATVPLRYVLLISMTVVTAFVAWTAPEFLATRKPWEHYIGPGILINQLLTSHVLGLLFVFGVASVFLSERWNHFFWICLLCCPILLWGIVLTSSRTPLVGIAAVLCWLCLIRPSRRTLCALGLMAALAVFAYVIQPTIFTSRGLSGRPEIWVAAFGKIMEQPLIGHGFEGSTEFFVEATKMTWRDPHNVMLAVALELGFIGLAIWIAMHVAALRACFVQRANTDAVVASCLVVFGLAAGLTEGGNFFSRPNESWFITWLPLGFAVAATAHMRTNQGSA
ncbi:O-antigen ligase family protein [Thauera sp. Sel9]|uniref:O-antigen ligase family protein n=1 Tax=Thauera sp. Sel9 TaxID=2974299 RepID=UPI0021E14A61|nr:O-antigen ligase family protein [Thauera sp. Sel9]MCV2218225.1 O-antigen ligase family protein [Thauera sp. Sel9]